MLRKLRSLWIRAPVESLLSGGGYEAKDDKEKYDKYHKDASKRADLITASDKLAGIEELQGDDKKGEKLKSFKATLAERTKALRSIEKGGSVNVKEDLDQFWKDQESNKDTLGKEEFDKIKAKEESYAAGMGGDTASQMNEAIQGIFELLKGK
jgi:galactitol-specific phosphotransferase system IIB component